MSNLLISEAPLIVLPSLANAIGLNEALVLQQIHFWISQSNNEYDGHKWMYRTDQQWINEFSFWSESTMRRAVTSLKKAGLVRVEKLARHFGGNSFDQKKYYTVIYSAVDSLTLKPSKAASGQNDHMEDKPAPEISNTASSQNDQMEAVEPTEGSVCASSQDDQMEPVIMTVASSQDDQFRSGQNDYIRTSQNDQMFTENKKEYYREEGEEPAATGKSSLFDIDLKPASALSSQKGFPMFFDWQPSKAFFARCKIQGIQTDRFTTDEQESILGEFRSYWEGRGSEFNQGSWEHKLASQLKRKIMDRGLVVAGGSQAGKAGRRAAVTEDVMDIANTNW